MTKFYLICTKRKLETAPPHPPFLVTWIKNIRRVWFRQKAMKTYAYNCLIANSSKGFLMKHNYITLFQ